MSLTSQLAGAFDGAIQRRGTDYFRSGRVRIDSASASRIVATVRGSSRDRVELEREGRSIHVSCTCPYFDVDLCKHLWAVLLAAAGEPLLQGKGLKLVHGDFFDEDDLDDEFDEDEDGGDDWIENDDDDEDDQDYESRYPSGSNFLPSGAP